MEEITNLTNDDASIEFTHFTDDEKIRLSQIMQNTDDDDGDSKGIAKFFTAEPELQIMLKDIDKKLKVCAQKIKAYIIFLNIF